MTRRVASLFHRRLLAAATAASLGVAGLGLTTPAALAAPAPDLGPKVTVFDPSMSTSAIADAVNSVWEHQFTNEMGTERYAFLFKPGSYGTPAEPLQLKVGYYTEIAGLGASPGDVQINGKIESFNRCYNADGSVAPGPGSGTSCFALNNFWRTLANLTLTVNGTGQDGCTASANFWAVSQAVSLRRVDVKGGNLSLMDYCSGPSFASGGFLANSRADVVINGSQQQWYARNSKVGTWTNAVWNQVFSGVTGAPDDAGYPDPPYTTLAKTPLTREKPYLFLDAQGRYQVRVPAAATNTSGTSWDDASTGTTLALSDFFVATPSTSVQSINSHLARGEHLLLTPGVYDIAESIAVKRPNTVVLGLGHATLTAVGGSTPLTIADVPGVVVAGLTIDAGTTLSPVLLQVGSKNGNNGAVHTSASNPTTLSDVYFRVGGPHIGKTEIALEVNSPNVLIDHTWVWRADHGVEGFTAGVNGDTDRWRTNLGRNGVVVNGANVTATGLFVEHFQEFNTIWNGEDGRVLLYQNELPYDAPTQADWTRPDGTLGWAAYKVGINVLHHELWGAGVYVFNQNNPAIVTANGYEVPNWPGVRLVHIMTKNLSGPGTISHIVNGIGKAVDGVPDPGDADGYEDPSYLVSYP